MNSRDFDDDDDRDRETDSDRRRDDTSPQRAGGPPESQTIDTDDPVIVSGPPRTTSWKKNPDSTMVVETNRIQQPDAARNPAVLMVPVEYEIASDADRRDHPRPEKRRHDRERDHDRDDDDDDRDRPAAAAPSMMKTLLFAGLVALVCGVAGAWGYSYFFGGSKSGDQTASQGSKSSNASDQKSGSKSGDNDSAQAETGKEIPGFTRADDAETLRKQNEHLAERIDRLSERVDGMTQPRNQTPPDLRTLQIKVGNLAKTVEDMGDLPSRFRSLESRMEDLDQKIQTLKSNASNARGTGGRQTAGSGSPPDLPSGPMSRSLPALAPEPQPATETPFGLQAAPDPALTEGIRLFRDGRYRDAQNIFRKLQLTRSWDARVWYFSALTRGLLTGDWNDQTRRLVARGLELEKDAQPPSTEVDRSLSGLTKAQGKDWLASFRTPAVAKR